MTMVMVGSDSAAAAVHGVHAAAKQVFGLFFILFILGWPALCSLCHAKPVLFTEDDVF